MEESTYTEPLFTLNKKFIDPLLQLSDITIDVMTGKLIMRDSKIPIYFNRDKGHGEVYEVYPIFIINDAHYKAVKKDESGTLEIFNPFIVLAHMTLVASFLKRALVPYYISSKNLEYKSEEECLNYISIFSGKTLDGRTRYGYVNLENPNSPKELFAYTDEDPIKAIFCLCATVYNTISRKKLPIYEELDKSWRKIKSLIKKWEENRKYLNIKILEKKVADKNKMEAVEIDPLNNDGLSYKFGANASFKFVMQDDKGENMQNYLNSLYLSNIKPTSFADSMDDAISKSIEENENEYCDISEDADLEKPQEKIRKSKSKVLIEKFFEGNKEINTKEEKHNVEINNESLTNEKIDNKNINTGITLKEPSNQQNNYINNPMYGYGNYGYMNNQYQQRFNMMNTMYNNMMMGMGMGMIPNSEESVNLTTDIDPFSIYNQ